MENYNIPLPKFSIITIVYNGEKEIVRTIESVLGQTYKNLEYIIVDGASKDKTVDIVKKYEAQITRIISEPDTGIYNAMNKGLKVATGDYIYFANSGDEIACPNVLASVADAICAEEEWPDIVYGGYQELRDGIKSEMIPSRSHKWAWYGMFASHQSTFCKLETIRNHDIRFDESYKIAADYKFLITMVKLGTHFVQLPISISLFDVSGISNTNQNLGLYEADRARQEVLELGWTKRKFVILVSRLSRFAKKHMGVIYRKLRNR